MLKMISIVTSLLFTASAFAAGASPSMRPDVEAFVHASYKQPQQAAAATQLAQALQSVLNSGKDSASIETSGQNAERARRCVSAVFGAKAGKYPSKVVSEIEAKTFDTTARQVTYIAFQQLMRDSPVRSNAENPCAQ